MHISVKLLSEGVSEFDTIALEVAPGDKVGSVKDKIEQIEHSLPTCKQLLVYAGQQLEKDYSLDEYGIENDSTILLVYKPTGE